MKRKVKKNTSIKTKNYKFTINSEYVIEINPIDETIKVRTKDAFLGIRELVELAITQEKELKRIKKILKKNEALSWIK